MDANLTNISITKQTNPYYQGRNQSIFSGRAKWCKLLLYLTNTYVYENFGVGNCRIVPPLVAGLHTTPYEKSPKFRAYWHAWRLANVIA